MSIMGVVVMDNDPRTAHYIAIDEYISTNLTHLSYSEIKEAFMMLLRGEFDDYPEFKDNKLFNKLDCVLVSKVIKCYEKRKHEIIDPYKQRLDKKVKEIEQAFGVDITLTFPQEETAPDPTPADTPAALAIQKAVKEMTGKDTQTIGIGGGTVAAYFREKGLPAVCWATLDDTLHAPNEYSKIDNLINDAKVFAHIFMQK